MSNQKGGPCRECRKSCQEPQPASTKTTWSNPHKWGRNADGKPGWRGLSGAVRGGGAFGLLLRAPSCTNGSTPRISRARRIVAQSSHLRDEMQRLFRTHIGPPFLKIVTTLALCKSSSTIFIRHHCSRTSASQRRAFSSKARSTGIEPRPAPHPLSYPSVQMPRPLPRA